MVTVMKHALGLVYLGKTLCGRAIFVEVTQDVVQVSAMDDFKHYEAGDRHTTLELDSSTVSPRAFSYLKRRLYSGKSYALRVELETSDVIVRGRLVSVVRSCYPREAVHGIPIPCWRLEIRNDRKGGSISCS